MGGQAAVKVLHVAGNATRVAGVLNSSAAMAQCNRGNTRKVGAGYFRRFE